jgi:uncharacterized integral membrane protein (TIGR00697 family)
LESKVRKLYIVLGVFFITNALLAEFIGVKIFSLERTFGLTPVNWSILGFDNLSFNLTAGVLIWPFVFVLTDIINEYFGRRGVRLLTFLAVIMIGYAFLMITVSIKVVPADFWIFRQDLNKPSAPLDMNRAFNAIFGQGQSIILGSLTAFLLSQLVDIYTFHLFRKITGSRKIWLRSTGSTIISQLVDSFVVLFIAFHLSGPKWPLNLVFAIAAINYGYKVFMAIIMTPLIYLVHYLIDRYLGKRLSHRMIESAAQAK